MLFIHKDTIKKGKKVLIVDDLLTTGGTVNAACRLVEKAGGKVTGCLFLLELKALSVSAKIPDPIISLLSC